MTWDEKLGRIIRQFFSALTGRTESIDEWEDRKRQAWDEQEKRARARSSAELHEELERKGRSEPE